MLRGGFTMGQVKGMSLRQIQAHLDLMDRQKRNEEMTLAMLVRLAYHADGKGFKEFVDKHIKG